MKNVLAIDLGNSSVTAGLFADRKIIKRGSFSTEKSVNLTDFSTAFDLIFGQSLKDLRIQKIVISSVVPELDSLLVDIAEKAGVRTPVFVSHLDCCNLKFSIAEPQSVGADRIANALAVREYYKTPALVIDVGTATSFDFVSVEGAFAGGVIMPGPTISFEALRSRASKLSDIKLSWPIRALGQCTAEAINSGVHFGHLYAVEGLVKAIQSESGTINSLVVTGGAGNILTENSDLFDIYDPDLTLRGLEIVANGR